MSANIQTLTGPAPQPSEVPAGTTSANAGRKRRSPAKRADVVRNGGRKWTLEEKRDLWLLRHRTSEGGPMAYKDVGGILNRTAQACRLVVHHLAPIYIRKGYEGTFHQRRPDNLGQPAVDVAATHAGAQALFDAVDAADDEDGPSEAEMRDTALANMGVAHRHMREVALREDQERVVHEQALFRNADGHVLQERIEVAQAAQALMDLRRQGEREQKEAAQAQLQERMDAAQALIDLQRGLGTHMVADPPFNENGGFVGGVPQQHQHRPVNGATKRMRIDYVVNSE